MNLLTTQFFQIYPMINYCNCFEIDSNAIELTVHISFYCILDLRCAPKRWSKYTTVMSSSSSFVSFFPKRHMVVNNAAALLKEVVLLVLSK